MNHRLQARATSIIALSAAACAFAVAVGCSDTASSLTKPEEQTSTPTPTPTPGREAGSMSPVDASVDELTDAASDATERTDACADGGCLPPPVGCAAQPQAAFCDDFDTADALTPGKTKWDFVEPTEQPVATLSTVQKVSAPSSLLSRIIDATTPGAKLAKTVTKAGFQEATWEYDVFFENVGTTDGFFLDDFQFTDGDNFGFRLVMFANAGAIGELKVEHNQNATGGPYVIEPPLAAGKVALGKWHHFKQRVAFEFANPDAGAPDGGATNGVEYSLWVDDLTVPAFQKKYAGPTRQQAAFARIAAMPLVFNKEKSAGLKIYWDNHVLELK
jgi:hypothetical protein